jgi:uncharacterized protein
MESMGIEEARKPDFGKRLNPLQRSLYFTAGSVSLALGVLGIPLPLLPTTPFLLLSAWCYARSSQRFYCWLLNHRLFGEYIRDYREKGGVQKKVKITAIALLWVTISISATFAVGLWWVRLLLLGIAIGVSIHILSLKTVKKDRLP